MVSSLRIHNFYIYTAPFPFVLLIPDGAVSAVKSGAKNLRKWNFLKNGGIEGLLFFFLVGEVGIYAVSVAEERRI